jgi:two-component system nitrogen regulation response regulator GlnG
VRQLENICHWLTVMAPAQLIEAKDLPPEVMAVSTAEFHPQDTSGAGIVAPVTATAQPLAAPFAGIAGVPAVGGMERDAAHLPAAASEHAEAPAAAGVSSWESGLEAEAQALLAAGRTDVWDVLSRRFESRLILTALTNTRGRRIEAAQKLGIGRNTITRKIQELGIE